MVQIGDGLSKFAPSAEIQQCTLWSCLSLYSGPVSCKGPSLRCSWAVGWACPVQPCHPSRVHTATEQCVLCCCRMWIYHSHSSACSDTAQSRAAVATQACKESDWITGKLPCPESCYSFTRLQFQLFYIYIKQLYCYVPCLTCEELCLHPSILLNQVLCPFNLQLLGTMQLFLIHEHCHFSVSQLMSLWSLCYLTSAAPSLSHCPVGSFLCKATIGVTGLLAQHSSLFFYLCFTSCSIPACALVSFVGGFILPLWSLHASACWCLLPPHLVIYVVLGQYSTVCNSFLSSLFWLLTSIMFSKMLSFNLFYFTTCLYWTNQEEVCLFSPLLSTMVLSWFPIFRLVKIF